MGASGKKGAKETEDRVVEPREVDILCGRGGLSNHHPGNEWYRRLIRSNRPLYRACPKHTKLLVSKAIVQAVEQQGGRFLERSRKDGFWYPVPYKRAVDKTSQGLRERERDDDDEGAGGGGGGGGAPMTVPHQFSGQGAPHKLSDLADVAIAHATRMDGLPRSASELIGASGGGGHQQQQHHRSAAMAASVAHRAAAPHARAAAAPSPRSAPPPPPPQQQRLETKDLSPLPPTLEPRQSSMFRLLKDTKLLPAESAFIMGPNAPQHGAAGGAYAKEAPATARATAMPVMYGVSPAPPYSAAAAAAGYAPAATNGAPAPTLTRLTSQVSDWLNSFWPVPARGESTMAAPVPGSGVYPPRAPPPPPPPAGYGAPPPPKGVAPPIVTIPPPEPQGPIQINTIPPMKNKPPTYTNGTAETDEKKSNTVAASSSFANTPIAKPTISSHDTKHPSQQHQVRTNENHADNKADDEDNAAASASGERPSLAPTELESSVSATLLKLASRPSRFFSGISALFGDEVGQDDNAAVSTTLSSTATLAPTNNQVVVDAPPIVAGTKRSKASLLDDDDSSGDEAAAAAVMPNKKRRTSLLDDYQESAREARMRNLYD